jgi:hypothetical protein
MCVGRWTKIQHLQIRRGKGNNENKKKGLTLDPWFVLLRREVLAEYFHDVGQRG